MYNCTGLAATRLAREQIGKGRYVSPLDQDVKRFIIIQIKNPRQLQKLEVIGRFQKAAVQHPAGHNLFQREY